MPERRPTKLNPSDHSERAAPRLALRPREAARALGISPRLLWTLSNRGEVPCVRIGRAVVYSIDGLREWLARRTEGKGGNR